MATASALQSTLRETPRGGYRRLHRHHQDRRQRQ
jgi:hypothetical protein